jgi:hypothetical protein
VTCYRFSPGPPVSYTNKTDRHDITEILLKVALIGRLQQQKKKRLKNDIKLKIQLVFFIAKRVS